jgi:hypothetical protein
MEGLTDSSLGAASFSRPFVMVALLELDVGRPALDKGRENGSAELSLLRPVGRSSLASEPKPAMALARLLTLELCLLKFGGVYVLHRLLTLSLRFILALNTKPPMPFVGDRGRSGDILPCVGDMRGPRDVSAGSVVSAVDGRSVGGANFCDSSTGSGDCILVVSMSLPEIEVVDEKRLLRAALSRTEARRDEGDLERVLSVGGLAREEAEVESRDMPGSGRLLTAGVASAAGESSPLRR